MIDNKGPFLHNMYLNVWQAATKKEFKGMKQGLGFNCSAAFYAISCLGNNLTFLGFGNQLKAKQKRGWSM